MLGAIAGDIIGSIYDWDNIKTKQFDLLPSTCFFTDDTVLTVALADAILSKRPYALLLREYYRRYLHAGYGERFHGWVVSDSTNPYNSWGNGAAMRISPVGFAYQTLPEVLSNAEHFTRITHNHPEGIKGAQATAASIFLARTGHTKVDIRDYVEREFNYDLSRTIDDIRPTYRFNESCQGTVPQAITCFLESNDYEDAIRNAISLGGDSDTLACITGGISEAYYQGIPSHIETKIMTILDKPLAFVTSEFIKIYRSNCN